MSVGQELLGTPGLMPDEKKGLESILTRAKRIRSTGLSVTKGPAKPGARHAGPLPGDYQGGPPLVTQPGFGSYPRESAMPTMRRIICEAKKK